MIECKIYNKKVSFSDGMHSASFITKGRGDKRISESIKACKAIGYNVKIKEIYKNNKRK